MSDRLKADYSRGRIPSDPVATATLSLLVFDSLAIFVKGRYGRKFAPIIGGTKTTLTEG